MAPSSAMSMEASETCVTAAALDQAQNSKTHKHVLDTASTLHMAAQLHSPPIITSTFGSIIMYIRNTPAPTIYNSMRGWGARARRAYERKRKSSARVGFTPKGYWTAAPRWGASLLGDPEGPRSFGLARPGRLPCEASQYHLLSRSSATSPNISMIRLSLPRSPLIISAAFQLPPSAARRPT